MYSTITSMFSNATSRGPVVSLLKSCSPSLSNCSQQSVCDQKTVNEEECLRKLAEELNNVAVDLYSEDDHTLARDLYTNAAKAIMATVQPKERRIVTLDEVRAEYINQLVQAKQRLHDMSSSSSSSRESNYKGLNSYQWSEADSEVSPKCLSEAIKIVNAEECSSQVNCEYTSAATMMYNMGLIHMKNEELEIAETVFELALELRPELDTDDELCNALVFAALFNNLGYIEYSRGNVSEAKESFDEALQIGKKALSQAGSACRTAVQIYTHLGTIYYNIGIINANLGLNDEVMRSFDYSLEMQKAALGESHPDIAIVQHNIGMVYLVIGRVNDAMDAFLESLRMIRFAFGNDHHHAAKELFHLGKIHEMKGEYDEALHVFQETLRVERKTLGMYHPDTIATLCEIGQVHRCKGHLDKAIHFYNDALVVAKASKDSERSPVIFILCQMVKVNIESGDIAEATRIHTQLARIIDSTNCDNTFVDSMEFAKIKELLANPPAAAAA